MAGKTYALLVGINSYTNEAEAPTLSGCLEDVEVMKEYLDGLINVNSANGLCKNLYLRKITNNGATKKKVIRAFVEHLTNKDPDNFDKDIRNDIEVGDTVLFYFSGHGSLCKSAIQNPDTELDLDETIVCQDSRSAGKYDLADKELKYLLSLIPEGVQIIVIADSCHSGGIGKDTKEATRKMYRENKKRPPNTRKATCRGKSEYFFDPSKKYSLEKIQAINTAKYLMIAACKADQYAHEKRGRGVFTYRLIEELNKCNGKITYEQLRVRLIKKLVKRPGDQSPVFNHHNGFEMDQLFLKPIAPNIIS